MQKYKKKCSSCTFGQKKIYIFVFDLQKRQKYNRKSDFRYMKIISAIFHFVVRHENLCFLVLFLMFVGFIDSNSLWDRHYVWESMDNLKHEISNYQRIYVEDSLKLAELKNNPRRLEEVARERYYMTRPDEDLFIIQEGEAAPARSLLSGPVENVAPASGQSSDNQR